MFFQLSRRLSMRELLSKALSSNKCTLRQASSTKEGIVLTRDGTTFVAWHPEKEFPYECSKPLPVCSPSPEDYAIVKKVTLQDVKKEFVPTPSPFAVAELSKLTSTCKHRWYPRARDKRRKHTPRDRDFL